MDRRDHDAELCECGIIAIDEILAHAGKGRIEKKQLDPLNSRDFVVLVERFARTLARLSDPDTTRATNRALTLLDVNWGALTITQRQAAFDAAHLAMLGLQRGVPPKFEQTFQAQSVKVTKGTRFTANRFFKLGLEGSFSETDERIAEFVKTSNLMFVTDEFGRRAEGFTEKAQKIVAKGLEEGLDRNAIGKDLGNALGPPSQLKKNRDYWTVLGAAFMGRARSFTLTASFTEAGIITYRFHAVMDERTTIPCRMMHDTVWKVADAQRGMDEAMERKEPADIKAALPWVQEGTDEDGNKILYIKDAQGKRQTVAEIIRPGSGKDDRGEYRKVMSDPQMAASGIITPPLHGRCRSTMLVY